MGRQKPGTIHVEGTMSRVAEMSWIAFEKQTQQTDLVLLPLGAVEVYGPHLPMGTDGFVAMALATRVAERIPALVAPLIPVGYSRSLQDFPGTLNVSPEALKAYVQGICESFLLWGCRRFLFLNGHLGNVAPIAQLCEELRRVHGATCAQVDIWRFIQPLTRDLMESDTLPFGHASEAGTSVMLYLHPELVDLPAATRTPPPPDPFPDILQTGSYREKSGTGVLGDATRGTAEKGEAIISRSVDRLVAFVESEAFR
ncbi:MAG: creatininase family protein [Nitrospinota bacterium]|nr:MAG: creatininase family protein [Nitrospinota bacterium]